MSTLSMPSLYLATNPLYNPPADITGQERSFIGIDLVNGFFAALSQYKEERAMLAESDFTTEEVEAAITGLRRCIRAHYPVMRKWVKQPFTMEAALAMTGNTSEITAFAKGEENGT